MTAAVVVAAVAVVLGGKALVSGLTGGVPEAGGRAAPPTPTSTVAGPILDCSASNLDLAVTVPSAQYTVGQSVPVTVTMSHHGRSCLVDGSDAGRQVVVTSGTDRIWSSADCPSGERSLLLAGDDVDTTVVLWAGGRSAEGCPADLGAVTAGNYTVAVTVPGADGATSEPVSFTLVDPAPSVDPNAVDPNAVDPNPADPNGEVVPAP